MIDLRTVDQLKHAPIEERLQIIELLLQSLKRDIKKKPKIGKTQSKSFKVRAFSLGQEVHADREELYSERG